MHIAAEQEDPAMLELLLTKRPNVMHATRQGDVPLTLAVRKRRDACVSALLASRLVDLSFTHSKTGFNALHEAAWVDDLSVTKLLLDTGAFEDKMNEPTKQGHGPLHIAAFRGRPELCQELVDLSLIHI